MYIKIRSILFNHVSFVEHHVGIVHTMVALDNTTIMQRTSLEKSMKKKRNVLVAVVDSFVVHTFDRHSYYFDRPVEVDIASVLRIHLALMDTYSLEELMALVDIVE